ncbi:hypothetical protein JOL62DRAFT_435416 [Phyllosticta paracitricarpa]|uniref:Uncharacterized protein n=1 Tax=Phyllosticta paracitricarpa TaxID=2016321 RepID=A0ABR1NCS9_9PEZI
MMWIFFFFFEFQGRRSRRRRRRVCAGWIADDDDDGGKLGEMRGTRCRAPSSFWIHGAEGICDQRMRKSSERRALQQKDTRRKADRHANHPPALVFSSSCHATSQGMDGDRRRPPSEESTKKKKKMTQLLRRATPQPLPPLAASHALFSNRSSLSPFPLFILIRSTIKSITPRQRKARVHGFLQPASQTMDQWMRPLPLQAANVLRRSPTSSALQSTPLCS